MLNEFISMIFPEYCIACSEGLLKGENQLCTACMYRLPQTDFHLRPENELTQRFAGTIFLTHALAYLKFSKSSFVQKILHSLKYENNQEIGVMLGRWYGAILKEQGFHEKFDLILPVPLHLAKLRKRGYNQSDCFAQGLSESMEVPWSSQVLIRQKANETQTKKGRFERWLNVEEIFAISDNTAIENQRVLLVDDVVTTGSTLEACLKILKENGSQTLSIATIAIATHD